MMRRIRIARLALAIGLSTLLFAAQPIKADAPVNLEAGKVQDPIPSDQTSQVTNPPISLDFNQTELDTIAASLPEGEARQMLEQKRLSATKRENASSDDVPKHGEEFGYFLLDLEKSYSRMQERIVSFLIEPDAPGEKNEWAAAFNNINKGKGLGHFVLTVIIAALVIAAGLVIEWFVYRFTENMRRHILDTAPLGRLHFLGRVVSRFLLNALGLAFYMLITFLIFAVFYDEGDPGYTIMFNTIVTSYYIRFFILAATLVLSPAAPQLRLFPLQDQDAGFLYRWTILIVVTGIVIADLSYLLYHGGISPENQLLVYSMSGLGVSVLLVVMIWRSRHRVARAIYPDQAGSETAVPSLRAKFAQDWHWYASFYVIGIGVFWFIRGLAKGEAAIVPQLTSLLLIPVYFGISHWAVHLLNIAAGVSPSAMKTDNNLDPQSTAEHEVIPAAKSTGTNTDPDSMIQPHLPLLRNSIRILWAILIFFLILNLWGIDLPIGRVFTATVLKIIGLLVLGLILWRYVKTLIDKKIRQEMPDEDEEMEEGGKGGSRIGTLLVLLQKFVLSVLIVIGGLIALSSLGLDIVPLIAGAGVVGLAIGFGSQTLVRDIISGAFFLIDDAFRVGDYIETGGIKGTVQQISLRSVKLRHARGMVFTIPFGDMGAVQNFSRDYIISKLDFRVRYDTDVEKVRKAIKKKVYKVILNNEELAPKLLAPIKSQGVRQLEDSAMIMRVKFKTAPGDQFEIRKEVFRLMQEAFKEEGIEFAHRNVTVYLPQETAAEGEIQNTDARDKTKQAAAAAALAAEQDASEKPSGQKN